MKIFSSFKYVFALFALILLLPSVIASGMNVEVKAMASTGQPISVITGEKVPVSVFLNFSNDFDDILVRVELNYSGGKIESKTDFFDALSNATYSFTGDKALFITIPSDIIEKSEHATIRITIEDEDGNTITSSGYEYNQTVDLIIQKQPDSLELTNVSLPASILSGNTESISVTIRNSGADSQSNIYVEARIPALGIVSKRLVGQLSMSSSISAEIPVMIPDTAKTGAYETKVRVFNDYASDEKTYSLQISGITRELMFSDITPLVSIQEVESGQRAVYQIVILNLGTEKQTYTIGLKETEDWANAVASPSLVTLNKGSNAVIDIYISPKNNIEGEKTFKAEIRNNNQILKTIDLVADVKKPEQEKSFVDKYFYYIIIAAVILLLLIVFALFGGLIGKYRTKIKALLAVGEAREAGREAAKKDAIELMSSIMGKVMDADNSHVEVAKERAAGRAQDVIETLREDEIEEVFNTAVKKLGAQKTEGMNEKQKASVYDEIKSHANGILSKITHKLTEKDIDDVVDNVTDKLSNEEIEDTGVEQTVQTLTKLREKLDKEIEKLKIEEEEEVIIVPDRKARKSKRKIRKIKRKTRKKRIKRLKKAKRKIKRAIRKVKKARKSSIKRKKRKAKRAKTKRVKAKTAKSKKKKEEEPFLEKIVTTKEVTRKF